MKPLTPIVTISLHPDCLSQNNFLKRIWGKLLEMKIFLNDPGNYQKSLNSIIIKVLGLILMLLNIRDQ